MSILFALILICFAVDSDDGFSLFMEGFMNIVVVFNIDTLFGITETSYNGFGNLIQLIYAFIAIFCFSKIIMSARQDGLISFMRGHYNGK